MGMWAGFKSIFAEGFEKEGPKDNRSVKKNVKDVTHCKAFHL